VRGKLSELNSETQGMTIGWLWKKVEGLRTAALGCWVKCGGYICKRDVPLTVAVGGATVVTERQDKPGWAAMGI